MLDEVSTPLFNVDMRPTDERLREVFNTLEPYIEQRYGIPVIINDVPDPFSGDLDGSEIHVDYDIDVENAVFIIAHLFGHTVQWNLSEQTHRLRSPTIGNPKTSFFRETI